jgi:hypothetical protein
MAVLGQNKEKSGMKAVARRRPKKDWPPLQGIPALRRGIAYGTLGELCAAYDSLTEAEQTTVRRWLETALHQPFLQLFESCPTWYARLLVHILCAACVAAREDV